MTMANVAWALAMNGERVLTIDWDLEAPGLHRYFHPFLDDPDQRKSTGLIDRVWEYVEDITGGSVDGHTRFRTADCSDVVQPLELPPSVRGSGCLHLLGAGRQDEEYSRKVGGLDWREFYERFDGKQFLDRLIEWARSRYTHILIDSRTGVADTAGICTAQLPDSVVLCFVYNRQSIDGTAAVVRSIADTRKSMGLSPLATHVLPCRVEERGAVEAARRYSAKQLADILGRDQSRFEMELRRDEVRHYAWCAFEEKLAIFEDVPGERGSLLEAMHDFAKRIVRSKRHIRIVPVEPEILSFYWRRAAFSDPRLAELEALTDASSSMRVGSLVHWLEDIAIEDRSDWLIELGEAAVEVAASADDTVSPATRKYLGEMGMNVAERAYVSDRREYATRFSHVLVTRATMLQRDGALADARRLLESAGKILSAEKTSLASWRNARVLERLATVHLAIGDFQSALKSQDAALEIYLRQDERRRPIASHMDLPKAVHQLSKLNAIIGDEKAALHHAGLAMRMLEGIGVTVLQRYPADAMEIILNWVDVSARFDPDNAERVLQHARVLTQNLTGSAKYDGKANAYLDASLAMLLARQNRFGEALDIIDQIESRQDEVDERSLAEAKVPALIGLGRQNEAIDYLLRGIRQGTLPASMAGTDMVKEAALAAGRQEDLVAEIVSKLNVGDNWVEALSKLVGRSSDALLPPKPARNTGNADD